MSEQNILKLIVFLFLRRYKKVWCLLDMWDLETINIEARIGYVFNKLIMFDIYAPAEWEYDPVYVYSSSLLVILSLL